MKRAFRRLYLTPWIPHKTRTRAQIAWKRFPRQKKSGSRVVAKWISLGSFARTAWLCSQPMRQIAWDQSKWRSAQFEMFWSQWFLFSLEVPTERGTTCTQHVQWKWKLSLDQISSVLLHSWQRKFARAASQSPCCQHYPSNESFHFPHFALNKWQGWNRNWLAPRPPRVHSSSWAFSFELSSCSPMPRRGGEAADVIGWRDFPLFNYAIYSPAKCHRGEQYVSWQNIQYLISFPHYSPKYAVHKLEN